MTGQGTGGHSKESNTIVRDPKPGGSQAEKSKGKGDDAINQSHESGRKPSDVDKNAQKSATQDPPDDGGFTEDNPNEHG
jgi:hypothetical protein